MGDLCTGAFLLCVLSPVYIVLDAIVELQYVLCFLGKFLSLKCHDLGI